MRKPLSFPAHRPARLALIGDRRGSVLVEAAFVMPLLIALLLGIMIYGNWFFTAHNIQQAANDAARAALAGLDATERRALVDQSVAASLSSSNIIAPGSVQISTSQANGYYTVSLSVDGSGSPLFQSSLFPIPDTHIRRDAVVQLPGV
ncbi:Flp pilus assembly protein TadG [Sphingobium fontiphilum]|uniref:Flp pilus assembly protein TadG n=1 Tax=Sphingobium fontiphilum TaxID=944425 RepID=A0A7W6DHK4_9SPHN|nr:TadE/TadG family type IV pilus assembly protein [Sphingobium fontiphilum]MBB3980745.1 Flp pilus assembly protein TadG [Sphingobium fontiphilum]